jgi:proteic killer suppression protein
LIDPDATCDGRSRRTERPIVTYHVIGYIDFVIRSFAHKGLRKFFETGSNVGIRPEHKKRLRLILGVLNAAVRIQDVALPGLGLHRLSGRLSGFWSVSASGNWRVIFRFEDGEALDVDYIDYH